MAEFTDIPYEQGWQRIKFSFDKLSDILDSLYKGEEIDTSKTITRKEHSEVYTYFFSLNCFSTFLQTHL